MSETLQKEVGGTYYSTAPIEPNHLFPVAVERVFKLLDSLAASGSLYVEGEEPPGKETIQWAKKVLLRVLPSYYLRTARIETFQGEIHVSWERGNRRIVAFLPSPGILKIYAEWEDDANETKHLIRPISNPQFISRYLAWLYS